MNSLFDEKETKFEINQLKVNLEKSGINFKLEFLYENLVYLTIRNEKKVNKIQTPKGTRNPKKYLKIN